MGQLVVAGGSGYQGGDPGTVYVGTEGTLRILEHTPSGLLSEAVDHIDVRFNRDIDPASFTVDDIELTGPAGSITITAPPEDLGAKSWRIHFAAQSVDGLYMLEIGPYVSDIGGNEMDQDGDATPGEIPGDVFVGTLELDLTEPEIIEQNPTGVLTTWIDHVDIAFSEAVSPAECAITLTGPNGDIALSAPVDQGNNVWRFTFAPQITNGDYAIAIAADCFVDGAGNELPADYLGTFALDLAPGLQVLVITVNGGYNADGWNIYQTVVNSGANAVYLLLSAEGQAAAYLDGNDYDQIWVYDLSTATDGYTADWQAICRLVFGSFQRRRHL